MRIVLQWPDNAPHMRILFDALTREGHEVVYWVGVNGGEQYAQEGTIFHDHYDAWGGNPAPVFCNKGPFPPPADLIEKLYRTESLALTMMNKHFDASSVDERKHIYYDILGYWNMVFDLTKPDAVVYSIIPHTVYNYIVHDLAISRGVPVFSFEDTWVALRLLSFGDFWKGSEALRRDTAQFRKKETEISTLHPELQAYYREHVLENPSAIPSYIKEQRDLAKGFGLLKHRASIIFKTLREGTFVRLAVNYFLRLWRRNLKDEYRALEKEVDFSGPYIYFPLAFQPERTTSPQGDMYHDQILAVETLAAAIPDGWKIYVKEHPTQWWTRSKTRYSSARYRGYYERLARIRNVRLVHPETSSFELMKQSQTAATITGTAGWEALLLGKRPIVFGIPWYRDCPGLFSVRSVEDCREALKELRERPTVQESHILAYLKALEKNSLRAHIGVPPEGSPKIDPEENMRILAEHTCSALRSETLSRASLGGTF